LHTPALGFIIHRENPPEYIRSYAQHVETAGYDEVWVVEDCFFTSGIASAAAVLAATATIRVGLGIVPAVARNAAFLAMEVATLARLHPGRFLPGVGHGVTEWIHQIGALPASQLTALKETVAAVRSLLRGEMYTSQGQYVSLKNVQLEYPPAQVPPISVGVRGPRSLRLAGQVADGTVLAEGAAPAYVSWAKEQIVRGMSEAGRSEPHRITVFAWCCVHEDTSIARNSLRPVIASHLASGSLHAQIAPLGITSDIEALLKRGGIQLLQEEMPDEWIDQLAIVGNPDECLHAITRFAQAGSDSIVLVPRVDQAMQQMDAFARDVLPHLA
jgi:5,10-methylenetetrahydromethanopterin reductase